MSECGGSFVCQLNSRSSSGSTGPEAWSLVTNKSFSLFLPFVQELDEQWQAGLSCSVALESFDQSTEMFDWDAGGVPGGSGELCVTLSIAATAKATSNS